jgi:predicted ATP-grasp superfamily ATP-dependent carboligase
MADHGADKQAVEMLIEALTDIATTQAEIADLLRTALSEMNEELREMRNALVRLTAMTEARYGNERTH